MRHECSICHSSGEWSPSWEWWGSYLAQDVGLPCLTTCSDVCRKAVEILGGPEKVLGAIWDAKGINPRHNRKHYKDILAHKASSLVVA